MATVRGNTLSLIVFDLLGSVLRVTLALARSKNWTQGHGYCNIRCKITSLLANLNA